ncbi:hypothetical protein DI392_09275 [Vibrio albus]|uniref:DUF2780 domain-containing protein n=1 Tax=Vibrio albus TaxID=2200953 RepID=A0A2U3BA49_9VIBR|nr:DUF2780 domain-containing protein [Vibrio albus]PWI33643.1 hypothetical protein DI392_09275 [Vibrio albus]
MKTGLSVFTLSLLLTTTPSYALFGFGDSDDSDNQINTESLTSLASGLTSQVVAQNDSPIVSALTGALDVTPSQATGGAGALLSLASGSLSSSENSELASLIPGMDSLQSSVPGLSSLSTSMDAVNTIFGQLGMDSSMVSQFAPIILQYLTGQGASSGLLSSLTSLWQ